MMEEFISTKTHHTKLLLGILIVSCSLHFHLTYAAFPLERDVVEFAGILPIKRWIVFMEKVLRTCFNEIKRDVSHSLTDAVRCMAKMQYTSKCLYGRWGCKLDLIQPNILKHDWAGPNRPIIQFVVHQQFSINITILGLFCDSQITLEDDTGNMYIYKAPIYPFTFINPDNTIAFQNPNGNGLIVNEYGVVQRFNVTHFHQIRATLMYFRWSYNLITCFHIQVDVTARLMLDVISCLRCQLIVYDGPNEMLPIIMKFNDTDKNQKVEASTFQVFFVVIGNQQHLETLTYAPIYRSTTVFNLSNVEHQKLHFNNATYCKGHSMVSRQCVFTFYTYNWETIRFSLTDLQLMGRYQGTRLGAGIVLINTFHGKREKMIEILTHYNWLGDNINVDLIGTGSRMDVVVFVYSVFASLSMEFVMAATSCNVLLGLGNSISYTRYIYSVDDTRRIFEIEKSALEIFQSNGCLRIQSLTSNYSFQFSFPQSVPALVTTMYSISIPIPGCPIDVISPNDFVYKLDSLYNEILTVTSINVNCTTWVYGSKNIEINLLPCKLLCTCLQPRRCPSFEMIRRPNDKNACDICQFAHVHSYHLLTRIKPNISVDIRKKSNTCLDAYLWIGSKFGVKDEPYITINLNRRNTIKVPNFNSAHLCMGANKCSFEIPLTAIHSLSELALLKRRSSPRARVMAKTAYWRGSFYRRLSCCYPHRVTWNKAAKSCQEAGQFLLTIHSMDEFDFVKETFLEPHDTLILYVGIKREVTYLNQATINPVNFLIFFAKCEIVCVELAHLRVGNRYIYIYMYTYVIYIYISRERFFASLITVQS